MAASLSAINKLFIIQSSLLKNAQTMLLKRHLTTLSRRAVWVLGQNQHQLRHATVCPTDKRCNLLVRNLGTSSSSSIDDFRKREETREKEYEHQLSVEEKVDKSKEDEEAEAKNEKLNAIRTKILEAALNHVPSLGWSRNALLRGAEDAGLPSVVHGMFPEGGYALVAYFYSKCNQQLLAKMQEETKSGQEKVADPVNFVFRAIRARLELSLPFKSQWPQAMALMAAPQNASNALAQVLTLVDDICYYAGDRSVNMRWYTRRLGIATIMKMTEIFMLQDTSEGHASTWEFLQARLDEAKRLQNFLKQSEGATSRLQTSFSTAFETARNILGIGYERRA